ncbi:tetratricopeptide repeat protein [Candidatus Leptofilum sp.]|uniref:tetratricopeptide repeat protein n=1 Tax=Candidatus Leptofilum sp. TaxID=3241576 RepID=UPI003B5A08EB
MSDSINTGDIKDSKGVVFGSGQVNFHEHNYPAAPEKPTFPIHKIAHPQNPNFTGRTEILAQVAETLNAGQTTVVTQTIARLGGVGKTQLALAYSYAHLDSYDLIYWLSADTEPSLGEDLMGLARRLKLIAPETTDQQATIGAVQQWLGQTSHNWLLVYDNADQIEPQQLAPYLPRSGNGHVLITSRNPNYGGLGQVLELGLFDLDEAVAFLFRRKEAKRAKVERESQEWQEAADLAEALGRLPLALEHAVAYVESKGSSYARYHQLFTERQNELWQRAERPERYHATITTTWELAFDQIKKTPGALDLLNLCCFLDPESIPLDLLKQIAVVETLHATSLQTVVADELALNDVLGALRRYSLIQQTEGALTMHRLVQDVARSRMGAERVRDWLGAAIDLLCKAYHYDHSKMETWAAVNDLIPHLTIATELAAQLGGQTENAAYLNNAVGHYVKLRGSYAAAMRFYEQALAIRQQVLGDDHPDTAQSLNNMGLLLNDIGHLAEARLYLKQALTIRQQVLGDDHPDTAQSFKNMGILLQDSGQLSEAQPFFEQALAIYKKVLGDDHPDTARGLTNMGLLLKAMEQLAEAQPFFEQALAIYKKVLGDDHPTTASGLNNMGFILQAMGQLAEAQPFYEQALTIYKKVLGDDHPYTATSLNNMGSLVEDLGQLVEARAYYKQAIAILEKAFGKEHPHTQIVQGNLNALD